MKQILIYTILVCFLIGSVQAQDNSVTAWNNKQFTVGDTIVIGVKSRGRLYTSIREVSNNRTLYVADTLAYQKAIVKCVVLRKVYRLMIQIYLNLLNQQLGLTPIVDFAFLP